MPGLLRKHTNNHHSSSSPSSRSPPDCNGIWSCSKKDVTYACLKKFWSELPSSARRKLLRIDKQTLFDQVRKNLYCSRCNGLLLEGFSQAVIYGKSIRQGSASGCNAGVPGQNRNLPDNGSRLSVGNAQDDARDPSVHPWGGLAATRDSMLTLMDCFLEGTPLEVLQNVFDSARVRERDRELLYPDACGGGGRGWISQGSCNSRRGHGMKETCALHTARISCEALVDFWSALSEDTSRSLLCMKEEDFLEKLMLRFDSKRFCRDCRRNVVREFKELKELKRTRKEPHCNQWFCVVDTAFQYEVSDNMVQADWHELVAEAGGIYRNFEWALGTEEGKSDILEFEDVGLCESVRADGLELGNITACFITLRVWKPEGRYMEFSVKAHALKGRLCVHRRLIAGDGYIIITMGENIKKFFEHAEEAEEEEDEDFTDKEGSDLDSEGSQAQKHAKNPELARDFLLDAATVIFKEQVEKAFREGTARQNAHSIFVCLALSLLEERVHVACKEITMLEKQNKLLEEEEDEKREEEERKERKRLKDKEKKLRRKQKLKGKEQEKGKNGVESMPVATISRASTNVTILTAEEKQLCCSNAPDTQDMKDGSIFLRSLSPDMEEAKPSMDGVIFENGNCQYHDMLSVDEMDGALGKRDGNGAFITEHSKSARRKAKLRKGPVLDAFAKRISWRGPDMSIETGGHIRSFGQVPSNSFVENTFMPIHGLWKHSKDVSKSSELSKTDYRGNPVKWNENSHWSTGRSNHRYDYQQCVCGSAQSNIKLKCRHESLRESRIADTHNTAINVSKPVYKIDNPINGPIPESFGVSKGRLQAGMVSWGREEKVHPKRRWEHLESHQLHRDSVSTMRDSSDGTSPCVLATVPDSLNRNGKMFDTCSNGGTGSNLSASSENEKDHSISYSDHIECNARQCGLPSQCHVQQMNHVTIEQAVEGSLASNTVKSRSLTVAGSDARSTCSADADGFTFRPSSSKISKKEGINSIAGLSSHGPQYGNHLIFGVQRETTLNVGYDLGNAQGIDNVRGTCKCESVSSRTLNGSEDMQQLKGPLTGHLNAIVLAPENSIFPTMEMTCQHQMPAFNISNLSSPFFPLHCQPNPGYYPIRRTWSPLSANGLLQCPQPNKVLYSGSAGFGFLPSSLPAWLMPYPCLQALPPVFGARHIQFLPIGPNCVQFNELTQFASIGEVHTVEVGCSIDATSLQQEIKHPHEKQDFNSFYLSEGLSQPKTHSNLQTHDASGFSLFHFDSPSAVAIEEQDSNTSLLKRGSMEENHMISNGNCALQQHAAVTHKDQPHVEEYSLFATSHGNRFGFF